MSEPKERGKLLQNYSTESDDGPDKLTAFPNVVQNEEQKHSTLPGDIPAASKSELPPPYEPGSGTSAASSGMLTQHGSGWTAYCRPYAPDQPPQVTYPFTHTSVQNQTTVVQVQPYTESRIHPPPPPAYLGLAIFATLCCFWPLGVAAIMKSSEVNKHHSMGNYELARQSSDKARSYSRLSIIIGIVLNIVCGAILGVVVYFRISSNSYNTDYRY